MNVYDKRRNLIFHHNYQFFLLHILIIFLFIITGIFSTKNSTYNDLIKSNLSTLLLARRQTNIIIYDFIKKLNDNEKNFNYELKYNRNIFSNVDEIFSISMTGDWKGKRGYFLENWIDNNRNSDFVNIVNLNNGSIEGKMETIEHINEEIISSIAYDWTTKNLFIGVDTDSIKNTGRVDVCRKNLNNKTECGIIIYRDLNTLDSLSVDPLDGYLYWINRGSKRIERSFMNGKHHEKHPFQENYYTKEKIYKISSLTLDVKNKKLYYISSTTSSSFNKIISCDMYQRDSCKALISNTNAFKIDIFDDNIFWSSYTKFYGDMEYCKLINCGETKMSLSNTENIENFNFLNEQNQPERMNPNPCAINNGGCSNFCILHPGEPYYSCHCPVGVNLTSDGKTCNKNGIEKVLFIASASGLLYISLDTNELVPRPIITNSFINDSENNALFIILDIDYDVINHFIYWIEEIGNGSKIKRIKFDGTLKEEILNFNKNESISCLKIDYFSNNIIWLDSENGKIEMMSLLTKARRIVYFSKHLKKIKNFTYNINTGTLSFYEKRHSAYIIKRIQIDGLNDTSLIHLPLEAYPTGIEIDEKNKKIYWAESGSNSILAASLIDGSNVEIIISGLHHPQSISKLNDKLYFNSINDRGLNYIVLDEINSYENNENEDYGEDNFEDIDVFQISDNIINGNHRGLKATYLKNTIFHENGCKNFGCSHICSTVEKDTIKCLCPNGMILNNINLKECIEIDISLVYSKFSIDDDIIQSSLEENNKNILERMYLEDISDSIQFIKSSNDGEYILIAGTGRNPNKFHQQIGFIKRITLKNHKTKTLLMSTSTPTITGLGIDEISGNIYFSNGYLKRIEVINESGSIRRTFLWKNIDPSFVAVENLQNMLYFINDSTLIVRTSIFSNYENIFTLHKSSDPITSFTIDSYSRRLFWSTTSIHTSMGIIFSSNFDGLDKKQMYSTIKLHPLHLTTYQSKVYFFNKLNGTLMTYDNEQIDIFGQIDDLVSMNIYSKKKSILNKGINNQNPCDKRNEKNKCNFLCIPKNLVEYDCLCNDHFDFNKKTNTCQINGQFLMVSEGNKLLRIPISKTSIENEIFSNYPPYYFDIPNIGEIHSLVFDPLSKHQYFYWIDSADPSFVYRSSFNPLIPTISLDEIKEYSLCKSFYYLAFDIQGRQLFLSCSMGNLLNSSSIHSFRITPNDNIQYSGTILTEKQYSPRQLAIFNKLNALFFINALTDTSSQIIRCHFDGRGCKALTYTSTDNLPWHSLSLSIDDFTQRLTYISPSIIFSKDVHVELDLRQRLNINDKLHTSQAFGMTAIVFSHNHMAVAINSRANAGLYLLSYNTTSNVASFSDLIPIQYYFPNTAANLKIVERAVSQNEAIPYEPFACFNSECSHICRSQRDFSHSQSKFECLCPYNLRLDPDNSNNCIPTIPCQPYQYSCSDGLQCIHISKKCDRIIDCADTSDENTNMCYNSHLPTIDSEKLLKLDLGFWPCLSGSKSISKFEICDGKIDCPDKSDEMYCKCENPQTQFDCEIKASFDFSIKTSYVNIEKGSNFNGCIERYKLCDGFADCANSTDEAKNLCSIIEVNNSVKGSFSQRDKTFNLIIFGIGIAIFILLLCIILINCCKKKDKKCLEHNNPTETHVLLNQGNNNSQNPVVEVALKTYTIPSVVGSHHENHYILKTEGGNHVSHPVILENPSNPYFNVQHYTIDSSYATAYDRTPQYNGRYVHFYAPPPSAASLSTTYGVVKQLNNCNDSRMVSSVYKDNFNDTPRKITPSKTISNEFCVNAPPPYEKLLKQDLNKYKVSEDSSVSDNYYTLRSHNRRQNRRQQTIALQEQYDSDSDESNSNFI